MMMVIFMMILRIAATINIIEIIAITTRIPTFVIYFDDLILIIVILIISYITIIIKKLSFLSFLFLAFVL